MINIETIQRISIGYVTTFKNIKPNYATIHYSLLGALHQLAIYNLTKFIKTD